MSEIARWVGVAAAFAVVTPVSAAVAFFIVALAVGA